MASQAARSRAATAWCVKGKTNHKVMDSDLAEAFGDILDQVWSQPWLGNATTAQLLDELKARAELGGYADYRTVDIDG